MARVTVRVGDYKTDSSGGRGDGALELAALDNDPIALRSALWTATDQAYKSALAAYAQKQAELKEVQTPPQADDFSQEKPVISLDDPIALRFDENAWNQRVARASGLYRTDPAVSANQRDIEYSTASFRARSTTTWLVTSEGTIVRKSAARVSASICRGHAGSPTACASIAPTSAAGASLSAISTAESVFSKHAVDAHRLARRSAQGSARRRGVSRPAAPAQRRRRHRYAASLLAAAVTATRPGLGTLKRAPTARFAIQLPRARHARLS